MVLAALKNSHMKRGSCAGYLAEAIGVQHRRDATESIQPREERLRPGDRGLRINDTETHTHTHKGINNKFTPGLTPVNVLPEVCTPVETCPVVDESGSLHGHVHVMQREVEGVGEGNGHEHLLLQLRHAAHLQTEKKKK